MNKRILLNCLLVLFLTSSSFVNTLVDNPEIPAAAGEESHGLINSFGSQPYMANPNLHPSPLPGGEPSNSVITLGQPGTSFRYNDTIGETGVPYITDTLHLNYPWGIGASGTSLWIGEMWGNRVLQYSNDGAFQMVIGEAGKIDFDDTVLYEISDVAKDGSGNLWVVDEGANHVVKVDASGNMIGELNSPGNPGSGIDQLDQPQSIALDSASNIYVSDGGPWWNPEIGNHRILIYDDDGDYLATIGQTGTCGSGNDQLCGPQHITIAGDRLFVSDAGNHRVQIFDISTPATPAFITTIGTTGEIGNDSDHLFYPAGVALDAAYIYIADTDNDRVQVFDGSTYVYITTIGTGTGSDNDQFQSPSDVAVDAAGYLFVADFANMRVQQFSRSGTVFSYVRSYGTTGVPYIGDGAHFNRPSGLLVDEDGSIFITEDSGHRLIKLNADGDLQWTVGSAGVKGQWYPSDTLFNVPNDVALDSSGKVYVADRYGSRVQVFYPDGTFYHSVSGFGCVGGVAITPEDYLYAIDACEHVIKIYDADLNPVATWGEAGVSGSDNAHFNRPEDVAFDSAGHIYVSDSDNHRIQVYTSGLVHIRSMGETGVGDNSFDHFDSPDGLFVDDSDRLYVADTGNTRIQVFSADGDYLTTIGGSWGDLNGQLQSPSSVAVDGSGNVYIDGGNHRIQVFSPGVPDWMQVNINGFGIVSNYHLASLEIFNGHLYAGVSNSGGLGGQVWRSDNGTDWTASSAPGVGPTHTDTNPIVIDLIGYQGQLYASTGWGTGTGQIWRSPDGISWTQVIGDGFGNVNNNSITRFVEFKDHLYAAAGNGVDGVEIWRSETGESGSWTSVVQDGNGIASNDYLTSYAEFKDHLYAAVENHVQGAEIWRTSDGLTWDRVLVEGFSDPHNVEIGSILVFNNMLYASTRNDESGAEIYRSSDGTSWELVVGSGIDSSDNLKIESLYGFNGQMIAVANNYICGVNVWRSFDGEAFEHISPCGFGDSNNITTLWNDATIKFMNHLYIGTQNHANGLELWRYESGYLNYLPLILNHQ
ncbi:MAG: SMP-30/gluconolactonase/LRE family protein [Anaerolineaceae bacterium]|nr:SMP-30/gluconolactonase/LRE family protein [Anaerolineaceae bacterium]